MGGAQAARQGWHPALSPHIALPMADESPLDRFKLALTGAARAIAHEPEAEVSWSADAPTLQACYAELRAGTMSLQDPRCQAAMGLALLRIATEGE